MIIAIDLDGADANAHELLNWSLSWYFQRYRSRARSSNSGGSCASESEDRNKNTEYKRAAGNGSVDAHGAKTDKIASAAVASGIVSSGIAAMDHAAETKASAKELPGSSPLTSVFLRFYSSRISSSEFESLRDAALRKFITADGEDAGSMFPSFCDLRQTKESVSAEASARAALKDGTESSLAQGLRALVTRTDEFPMAQRAEIFLTAGNTGAFALFANRYLTRSRKALRPALCALLPGTSPTLMLDLGANLESTPEILEGYAALALKLAASLTLSAKTERSIDGFALLNIGTEGHKGTRVLQEAHKRFSHRADYHGFVEANQLFDNDVEVIVTDGFTGNIALKSAEGAARFIMQSEGLPFLDPHSPGNDSSETAKKASSHTQIKTYNPALLNGAMLLGYDELAVKAHGGSRQADWDAALTLTETLGQTVMN